MKSAKNSKPQVNGYFNIETVEDITLYTNWQHFKHKKCGGSVNIYDNNSVTHIIYECNQCSKTFNLPLGYDHLEEWQKYFYIIAETQVDLSKYEDVYKIIEKDNGKTAYTEQVLLTSEEKLKYYYGKDIKFNKSTQANSFEDQLTML